MKKLAIVTTHPIQYNAPLFKLLQSRGYIQIKVFYTWSQSQQGAKYDPGFGMQIEWDIPLLEGYDHVFVKNISRKPGSDHFNGIINPTLIDDILQWEADCILIFGWNFNSHFKCLRYFKNKIPIIFRGDSHLLGEQKGIKQLIRTIFLKWVYRYIDYALYVGTNNKLYYLRHGVNSKQLIFAPHAIDNDRYLDIDGEFKKKALLWRNELGIKPSDIVFLFAGKLDPNKNAQLLIKAFLKLKYPEVHLIILGNGVMEQQLKKSYSIFPNIHFTDFQNQSMMPVVYRLGDVFVLPSKGPVETWGLAINEAMASSKAVLVSNRCGCATDLVEDGINGFVFSNDNQKDLLQKMNKLLSDKESLAEMGKHSFNKIQKWSFLEVCKKIERITLTAK